MNLREVRYSLVESQGAKENAPDISGARAFEQIGPAELSGVGGSNGDRYILVIILPNASTHLFLSIDDDLDSTNGHVIEFRSSIFVCVLITIRVRNTYEASDEVTEYFFPLHWILVIIDYMHRQ